MQPTRPRSRQERSQPLRKRRHGPSGIGVSVYSRLCGGCSSVGRVQDCDSCCRGFEPHQPPQVTPHATAPMGPLLLMATAKRKTGGLAFQGAREADHRDIEDSIRRSRHDVDCVHQTQGQSPLARVQQEPGKLVPAVQATARGSRHAAATRGVNLQRCRRRTASASTDSHGPIPQRTPVRRRRGARLGTFCFILARAAAPRGPGSRSRRAPPRATRPRPPSWRTRLRTPPSPRPCDQRPDPAAAVVGDPEIEARHRRLQLDLDPARPRVSDNVAHELAQDACERRPLHDVELPVLSISSAHPSSTLATFSRCVRSAFHSAAASLRLWLPAERPRVSVFSSCSV